jgi:hypothetical protein
LNILIWNQEENLDKISDIKKLGFMNNIGMNIKIVQNHSDLIEKMNQSIEKKEFFEFLILFSQNINQTKSDIYDILNSLNDLVIQKSSITKIIYIPLNDEFDNFVNLANVYNIIYSDLFYEDLERVILG